MAVATAAGMFSSTLLTLLVVPVLYLAVDRAKQLLASPREALAHVRDAARALRPLAGRALSTLASRR
jgi:hypothetical protein